MKCNRYIENIIKLSELTYVVWENNKKTEEEYGIPHHMYVFMEAFYQTLNYTDIINRNCILQVESALGICNLMIPGENRIYVVGPYLTERISTADVFSNLISNNLPIEYEENLFYHSLTVLLREKKELLLKLLQTGLGVMEYREIKQEKRFPTQEHLHNQFLFWNSAEEAYLVLMKADDELFQAFRTENFIIMKKAEENYMHSMEGMEYDYEPHFLRESLQIANGNYHRFCAVKTGKVNQLSSLFYQFQLEIQKVNNWNDMVTLHRKMYSAYSRIRIKFSCQEYPYLVQQTLQYINSHWREKIALNDIADVLAVNKSHLSTVFNEAVGMKIPDYIHKLKIEWAKMLLQSTTLKIVDIAFLCGYEDASYFGKVYKKLQGETPMQTREKIQIIRT